MYIYICIYCIYCYEFYICCALSENDEIKMINQINQSNVNIIYACPIFKWVPETRLHDKVQYQDTLEWLPTRYNATSTHVSSREVIVTQLILSIIDIKGILANNTFRYTHTIQLIFLLLVRCADVLLTQRDISSCLRDDMHALSALLALCVGNPSVTSGFTRKCTGELRCFSSPA